MRPRRLLPSVALAIALAGCVAGLQRGDTHVDGEWPAYGNDPGGTRYSPLAQIDRGNVAKLRIAWTYRTGERAGTDWAAGRIAFEATPIMVDGTLYLSTPFGRVIALDPETGAERWRYDPKVDPSQIFALVTSRGVSTWLDPAAPPGRACRRRIFVGTIDTRLIALDAATGSPCADFGRGGEVNLAEGIQIGTDCRCYQVTSLGFNPELPQFAGSANFGGALTTAGGLVFIAAARDTALRAFDVDDGRLLWQAELPASAQATPMTYRSAGGKQFVVIAAGGHGTMQTRLGDHVVAFTLP